jgi:DNA-binding NarL/FixJ family response regulator
VLQAVGLTSADSDLYAAVIGHPELTAAELSGHCGMPARQVSRRLSRLISLGLVQRQPGHEIRYLAGAPDLAVSELIAEREQALRAARADVNRLMALHRKAGRTHTPADLVEVITGAEAIAHQVEQVHRSARTEVRVFDKAPYARDPDQHRGSDQEHIRAGVTYRILYDRAALAWPGRLVDDILPKVHSRVLAVQARVRPALPLKLFLADAHLAVLPADPAGAVVDIAYVIQPSALLDALIALFEAEWERGTPIPSRHDPPACTAPDVTTTRLLALLSAGFTDEHIARSLGCSPRTAQRKVAELMRELEVTTRFQLALRASNLGWL